jgi:hypothetical protein
VSHPERPLLFVAGDIVDNLIFFEAGPVVGRRARRRPVAPLADKWVISGGVKGSTVWPLDGKARVRRRYGKVILCRDGSCRRFVVYSLVDHRPCKEMLEHKGGAARPDLPPRLYQIVGRAEGSAFVPKGKIHRVDIKYAI